MAYFKALLQVCLEGFWKATNATVRNQELNTITRVYSVSLCLFTHDLCNSYIYIVSVGLFPRFEFFFRNRE